MMIALLGYNIHFSFGIFTLSVLQRIQGEEGEEDLMLRLQTAILMPDATVGREW